MTDFALASNCGGLGASGLYLDEDPEFVVPLVVACAIVELPPVAANSPSRDSKYCIAKPAKPAPLVCRNLRRFHSVGQ